MEFVDPKDFNDIHPVKRRRLVKKAMEVRKAKRIINILKEIEPEDTTTFNLASKIIENEEKDKED